MVKDAAEQARDASRLVVPIVRVGGIVVLACTLVAWAVTLQGAVGGIGDDLSKLSDQVESVVKLQNTVNNNGVKIDGLERELDSLRDDYKVLQIQYNQLDKQFSVYRAENSNSKTR